MIFFYKVISAEIIDHFSSSIQLRSVCIVSNQI